MEDMQEPAKPHGGIPMRVLRAIGRPIGRFFDWLDRLLGRAVLRFFGAAFFIGGAFILYAGIGNFRTSLEIPNWPSAPGHVTESRIGQGSKVRYRSMITYEYEVDGAPYEGHRVRYGESQGLEGPAKRRTERYPPGTQVQVRYNPEDPADAVLEEGTNWWALFPMGAGGLFLYAGRWCWRSKKRMSELEFS